MSASIQSFINFISTSGISITFFLIFLLIKKKDHRRVNLLLAGILFCFLSLFVAYAAITSVLNFIAILVMAFALTTPFALGPLLNFYVDAIYQHQDHTQRARTKHLIPFFLALFLFSIPVAYYTRVNGSSTLDAIPIYAFGVPVMGIVSVMIYLRLLFKKMRKYGVLVKNHFASMETRDLAWLKRWLQGILIFIVLDIALSTISIMAEELHELLFLNVAYLFGLIVYVGYSGIQQSPVFISLVEYDPVPDKVKKKSKPIDTSRGNKNPLEQQLISLFEEKKVYLDENLSLTDVASALDESPKKITELLNADMQTNFYAFVNHFRVEAFKTKLNSETSQNKTFLGLAYESGFKSKATFNRAFKEITGMTPKAYQTTMK